MRPLTELRDVERATVVKAGVPAATLERQRGAVVFAYLKQYLESGGPQVATSLPLGDVPVVTHAAGALPPFFSGLLPEGRRLTALRSAVKTSADDDFTLLLAVGADTIGDVRIIPEGQNVDDAEPLLCVDAWDTVRFNELLARETGGGGPPDRIAIPGVQDKVSARMISLPVPRQHERHLLKLNPPEFPHLVENEAFFLKAALSSGLQVPDAELVWDGEGTPGLLVRRFDRIKGTEGQSQSLAQEDACQVLGLYPADKYRVTAEEVVASLSEVCQSQPVAALTLLRQLAFAYLSCNGDAHAKNFSVYRLQTGEWRVTPAYDLPSSYPYGDTTMALTLNGRNKEDVGRDDFIQLGRAVRLRERAVTRSLDELCARVDTWADQLSDLPFDPAVNKKLARAVAYRRRRLEG